MMRGTFANIRIKNEMVPGIEGGYTKHIPTKLNFQFMMLLYVIKISEHLWSSLEEKSTVTGSSRDWAAKGTNLLGVKAVICESFERIHRSNLVGMGVLPLQFIGGENRKTLGLTGSEEISIKAVGELSPQMQFEITIKNAEGEVKTTKVQSRIDTVDELNYFKNGGILQYVISQLNK